MSVGRPKTEPTTHVRLSKAFVSEVQEFQAKKGIKTFEEAIRLYSDKDWKRALVQTEGLLKKKSDEKCDGRVKNAVESYVKRVTELENNIVQKDSEIGKLKWQLKVNADIARWLVPKLVLNGFYSSFDCSRPVRACLTGEP